MRTYYKQKRFIPYPDDGEVGTEGLLVVLRRLLRVVAVVELEAVLGAGAGVVAEAARGAARVVRDGRVAVEGRRGHLGEGRLVFVAPAGIEEDDLERKKAGAHETTLGGSER